MAIKSAFMRKEITPRQPCQMAGYDLREGPSAGILDPLYVSVLILCDEAMTPLVLCSYDLLGVDLYLSQNIKDAVYHHLGIPKDHVITSATHTHSGPNIMFYSKQSYDRNYVEYIVERTVQAVKDALETLDITSYAMIQTSVDSLATDRTKLKEESVVEMPLTVIDFKKDTSDILLCLISCHPTVLNEKNRFFSKDLLGAAQADVGNHSMLFLNGACANLSTRYTRKESSPKELKRLGKILGHSIKQAVAHLDDHDSCDQNFKIRVAEQRFSLDCKGNMSLEQRQQWLAKFESSRKKDSAVTNPREYESIIAVLKRKTSYPTRRYISISVVDLGPFSFIFLPFEVSSQDGERIQKIFTEKIHKPVFLICYTNGYSGYLPSGNPLGPKSSYGDIASPYTPETKKQIEEQIELCFQNLK